MRKGTIDVDLFLGVLYEINLGAEEINDECGKTIIRGKID